MSQYGRISYLQFAITIFRKKNGIKDDITRISSTHVMYDAKKFKMSMANA